MQKPNIIFLHIPKTAGQSIHHFLEGIAEPNEVAPARVNEQLVFMSVEEIRKFRVFSGHLDWSLLDCVRDPKFVFTVLREPVSRILSFYLFLRREAKALSPEELVLPQYKGLRAALELPCDQYFANNDPNLQTFLDNHYDNFYTYYFAGRYFNARQRLYTQKQLQSINNDKILELALNNMSVLNGVYMVDALHHLERDIRALTGVNTGPSLNELRVNEGDTGTLDDRMQQLEELGATKIAFDRIRQMTEMDSAIWEHFKDK